MTTAAHTQAAPAALATEISRSARLRAAWWLSWAIVPLAAAASFGGLLLDDLYQDPASVGTRFRASDLITLVVALPLLAAALRAARRGSRRGQVIWASLLAYAVYDYAFYVFGTAFNDLFLVHVVVFTLSLFALVFLLAALDVEAIAPAGWRRADRWVSGFLVVMALALGGMWIFYSLRYAIGGTPPKESLLVSPIASMHLAYVLDLALLVPGYALAGVLLWRRAPWGFVLAATLVASSVLHQLNYMAALVFQANADVPGARAFDPLEPAILVAFLVATALMFLPGRAGSLPAQIHHHKEVIS